MPVPITTALSWPCVTAVPPNTTHSLDCSSQSGSSTASVVLPTDMDSPVKLAWSTRHVAVFKVNTRASAGTRSPVLISIRSPGTNSLAGKSCTHAPFLKHRAVSDCMSFSASNAFSALLSCQTPTMALRIRMSKITAGSTKSTMEIATPGSRSSKNASAKLTPAASRRIFTSASSNCSKTSFHKGLPSSFASSLNPYLSLALVTCLPFNPTSGSRPNEEAHSFGDCVHGASASALAFAAFARLGGMALNATQ
mmetsp:Transcript_9500/g.31504  ORF Transcript_9500/g.31504 Transcript_9500/m.31504 type:complete len:252 (+) Transcript_9500:4114-4869(+)